MRKTFTGCLALVMTFTSASAFAQEFSDKGTFAVSADRLFGIHLTQVNGDANGDAPGGDIDADATEVGLLWQGGGMTPYTIPRVNIEYFVIDHLSVGGSIAFYNVNGDDNYFGLGGDDGSYFLFAPRVGGAWMFNDWAGIWPRGGLHYYSRSYDTPDDHAWQLVFNVEAAFVLSPWKNFAFTVGPAFDIGMIGEYDPDGPADEFDIHAHSFGLLSVGMTGYFNF